LGGSYKFTDNFTASLYTADNEDVMKKHYLGLNYVFPIASDQSLTLDFNGYKSASTSSSCSAELNGDSNTIWSLAATYAYGPHSFTLAHQRSTGSTGYNYGGYQNAGAWVTVVPPSTWPTRTGPTSTPKTSAPGSWATAWTSVPWHSGPDLQAGLRGG
jgi:hypothetical protein